MNHQIDPKSLKFWKNIHGKPEVDWQYADDWKLPLLHFNISHTSSLIACGVTTSAPIGIDVEEKQRRLKNDILAFARRYFSLHELEMLTHISDPEIQRKEFIKLWTLKEAYVKALGKGFSASPFTTSTIRLRDQMREHIHLPPHMISEVPEIIVKSRDDPENLGGERSIPVNLTLRKTIPFVEEECTSRDDGAVVIGGVTRLLG